MKVSVNFIFGANTEAVKKKIADLSKAMESLEEGTDKALGHLAGLAAGPLKAVFSLQGVDEMMNQLGALDNAVHTVGSLSNMTAEEMSGVTDRLIDLSKQIPIPAEEMANALYQINSAGHVGADGMELLEVAARAAVGGATDITTTADALTTVMNSYNLKGEEASRVSDLLFTTVKLGKTDMGQLGQNLSQVASTAATFGIKIEDVLGAIATLTKSGTPTAQAITQIRAAITSVNKSLGDGAFQNRSFIEALQMVRDKAHGSEIALQNDLGTVEAMGAVLGLTGENARIAAGDLAEMTDSAGSAESAFNVMSQSAGSAGVLLKANLLDVFREMGDALGEVGEMIAKALNYLFATGNAQAFLDILKPLVAGWGAYRVAVMASAVVVQTFGATASGASGAVVMLNRAIGALRANPFAAILTVVTAVGVGLYELYQHVKETAVTINDFEEAQREAVESTTGEVLQLTKLMGALKNAKKGSEEYMAAREGLVNQYGRYLPNLAEEIDRAEDLNAVYEKLVGSIQQTARAKAMSATIEKAEQEYQKGIERIINEVEGANLGALFDNGKKVEAEAYKQRVVMALQTGDEEARKELEAYSKNKQGGSGIMGATGYASSMGIQSHEEGARLADLRLRNMFKDREELTRKYTERMKIMTARYRAAMEGLNEVKGEESGDGGASVDVKALAVKGVDNGEELRKQMSALRELEGELERDNAESAVDMIEEGVRKKIAATVLGYEQRWEEIRKQEESLRSLNLLGDKDKAGARSGIEGLKRGALKEASRDAAKEMGVSGDTVAALVKDYESKRVEVEEEVQKRYNDVLGRMLNAKTEEERGYFEGELTAIREIGDSASAGLKSSLNVKLKECYDKAAKEYQDYTVRRMETEKNFAEAREALLSSDKGGEGFSSSVNGERAEKTRRALEELERERNRARFDMDWEEMMDLQGYGVVMDNLGNVNASVLEDMEGRLRRFGESMGESITEEQASKIGEALDKIHAAMAEADGGAVGLTAALREQEIAMKAQEGAMSEYLRVRGELTEAQSSANMAEALYGSESAETARARERLYKVQESNKKALKDLVKAQENERKAEERSTAAKERLITGVSGLCGAISDLGGVCEGETAEVLGMFSSVGQAVTSMGELMKMTAQETVTAVEMLESATVILAAITAAITAVKAMVNIFGKGNDTSGQRKYLESVSKLQKEIADSSREAMRGATGVTAGKEAEESIKRYKAVTAAAREAFLAEEKQRSKNAHSTGYRTSKDMQKHREEINEALGYEANLGDSKVLAELSGEQLKSLKENAVSFWATLNEEEQKYLDQIIEAETAQNDVLSELGEAETGLNLDEAINQAAELVQDLSGGMEDVSEQFGSNMKKAMLNLVKDKMLTQSMGKWYNDFASAMSDNDLSTGEVARLRQEYESSITEASTMYKRMCEAAGLAAEEVTEEKSLSGGYEQISETTGSAIEGRATAILSHVSGIDKNITAVLSTAAAQLQQVVTGQGVQARSLEALKQMASSRNEILEKISGVCSKQSSALSSIEENLRDLSDRL